VSDSTVPGDQAVELGVPAEPRSVSEVREVVTEFARRVGWIDERRVDDLRLLVSEIVTNAVAAHGSLDRPQPIDVRCECDADRFELIVRDRGGGCDPPPGPLDVPDPDPNRVSGFGLALIWTLADEAHFSRTPDGTEVRILFLRRLAPGGRPETTQPVS
jgi:anti-sigma regulatory factor (Ser/Thr protein kinase)